MEYSAKNTNADFWFKKVSTASKIKYSVEPLLKLYLHNQR